MYELMWEAEYMKQKREKYLLPSSQTARDPFQRLLFKQVLVFEPRSLYPDWHENWTVRPILKSLPSKRPLGISLGSGHLITKKTTQHIRYCLNALVWVWHASRPSWRGKGDFLFQCLWESSVWWNIVSFGISFLLGGKSRLFCATIIKARYVTVRLLRCVYARNPKLKSLSWREVTLAGKISTFSHTCTWTAELKALCRVWVSKGGCCEWGKVV